MAVKMIDQLIERIMQTKNPTAVGLDTQLSYLPAGYQQRFSALDTFEGAAKAIFSFNKELMDAVCDLVPCVKVQAAYYEMYGPAGMAAFERTIRYAREKGLVVIVDAKRNDISSTASAYATAFLGETALQNGSMRAFAGDFLTVNPYFGDDGILPFLDREGGIFVLVKTSNPSSSQIQDLPMADGRLVYQLMGDMVEQWGAGQMGEYGYSNVGAVVGATHPAQLQELRARMPHTFFLIPGYGAQGGTAPDLCGGFDGRGLGGVVNSSRGILCAWKKKGTEDFAAAARQAVIEMKEDLSGAMKAAGKAL